MYMICNAIGCDKVIALVLQKLYKKEFTFTLKQSIRRIFVVNK